MPIPFHVSFYRSSLLVALILSLPSSGSTAHTELLPTISPPVALDPPLPGGSLMAVGLERFKGWNRVRRFFVEPENYRLAELRPWVAWAHSLRQLPQQKRLAAINARVDASIPYEEDEVVWHQSDYWENPLEVIRKGRTDCEGHVILKMFLAAAAGIDREDMGIVVGRVPDRRIFHAVLIVRLGTARYVLDDLHQPPEVDVGRLADFEPIYAVDMARAWSFPASPTLSAPFIVAAP
jgi:predicted transglutaminase-like cysteine proteinase